MVIAFLGINIVVQKNGRMFENMIIFLNYRGISSVKLVAYKKCFIWKSKMNETVPQFEHLQNFLIYHWDYEKDLLDVLNEN